MVKRLTIETESAFAVGDLHGRFGDLKWFIRTRGIRDTTVVCCGDIGLGFSSERHDSSELKREFGRLLKETNCQMVLFRGNHDKPERFEGGFEAGERIHVVPDYTVVTLRNASGNEKHVLCIGGGLSIDRSSRIRSMEMSVQKYKMYHPSASDTEARESVRESYWENELPVYDEEALSEVIEGSGRVDVVATHCAPSFCEPLTKDGIMGWASVDPDIIRLSDVERGVMDNVYSFLEKFGKQPEKWVYGHYHYTHCDYVGPTKFRMIDMVRDTGVDCEPIF